MASLISRARATALMATLGALCVSAATAADMPFASPLPPPPPVDQPVEFGTGWYLRGDIGYSNMPIPVVVADFVNSLGRTGAVSGGLGFGYQYNNWLRTDFEIDRAAFQLGSTQAPQWCPSGTVLDYPEATANVASSIAGTPVGYLYDPSETCTPYITASLSRTTPMFNAYLDLGNWWGFTPYVGAGIGASYLQSNAAVNYSAPRTASLGLRTLASRGCLSSGSPPMASMSRRRARSSSRSSVQTSTSKRTAGKFSWNVMAGVSYDVTQNFKIDVHYRLLDAGSYTSLPSVLTLAPGVTKELVSQEVRVGVRLTSD